MGRGQPVADADEADAGPGEHRRHERHPLLVAAGPAAAVDHDEYVAVGFRAPGTRARFDRDPGRNCLQRRQVPPPFAGRYLWYSLANSDTGS